MFGSAREPSASSEPGHHTPYLYNAAGMPERTQATLSKLHAMYKAENIQRPDQNTESNLPSKNVTPSRRVLPRAELLLDYLRTRGHDFIRLHLQRLAPLHQFVELLQDP